MVNRIVGAMLTCIIAAIIVISSFLEFYVYVIALVGFVCLLLFLRTK